MNKLFIALLLICSFVVKAQITNTLSEEQIKLVMKFQEASWNRGDIRAYMDGYWKSDSLLFIGSKGPTYGWTKTLLNYQKAYPTSEKMGALEFQLIDITILSDKDAFVVGKWSLYRTSDTLDGHFTLLWKKINENWKIVADHSSD